MSELLSPAGTKEAFYAAIANGANAIYLGLDKFSARAYAQNFTLENLKKLVEYAHLREVKIFVTINTIIYDDELKEAFKTIDTLAEYGVDGIIVQDLAILHYISSNYESIHAHASTQMGIDDIEGAKLVKSLGVKRIVFARETEVTKIKEIKDALDIEVEAFIHGALCVAYSGNCLMSSMIGDRSGNRGRCAGCCRKQYTLVDIKNKLTFDRGYLLSMKDLNLSKNIKDISFIDSLKIEGRMKEPEYVGGVTRIYRKLLDKDNVRDEDLNKVFNRTYTKGLIFNENKEDLTNTERPNNYGYLIGHVEKQYKDKIWIRLNSRLNKGDQIRIDSSNTKEEISLPVLKMFSYERDEIFSADKCAIIYCEVPVMVNSKIYKTKDFEFYKNVGKDNEQNEYSKLPVNFEFTAKINKNPILKIQYKKYISYVKSDFVIQAASSAPITKENIENQLNKLNDTPYKINNLLITMDDNIFLPLKVINELRREAISKLNEQRIKVNVIKKDAKRVIPQNYDLKDPEITIEVSNHEQYEAAKEAGIEKVFFENVIPRNFAKYDESFKNVLVGGLNGGQFYKDKANITTDYSLNVVNAESVALLSSLGVNRITLSEEISKEYIEKLISNYREMYNTSPNLELIVYGRSKLMHTQYCPLRKAGFCGKCKEGLYGLKDDYTTFPLKFNGDCTMFVLNDRPLNIMDDIDDLKGISSYRLRFTIESKEEASEIINQFKDKLVNKVKTKTFDKAKHTHGHFIKKPL